MKRPRHNHGKRSTSRWNARCDRKREARRRRYDDPGVHIRLHRAFAPPQPSSAAASDFIRELQRQLAELRKEMVEDLELDLVYGTLSPLDRATVKAARRLAAAAE